VKLAGLAGMANVEAIREQVPEASVVVLAICGDPETRSRAQTAGAEAVVENCAGDAALMEAIRAARS
jgi:DNA-binding NarL/FixJ family response regulator